MIKVAVMGFGTIGSGVVEVLSINKDSIAKRVGDTIEVKYVLDLRDFEGDPIQEKIVHDYQVVTNRIELLRRMNEILEAQAVEMCSDAFPLSDDKNENGTISDICLSIYSGGTPTTSEETYWNGVLPWLSSGETSNSFVTKTDKHISQTGVDNSSTKLAKAGSTVIASAGQGKTRGTVAINRIPLTTNQSIAAMTFNEDVVPEFVFSGTHPLLRLHRYAKQTFLSVLSTKFHRSSIS